MEKLTNVLEISQAENPNGRRHIKVVLHEIYPNTTQWNENGITYLEHYTRDNAESVKGMPLCAEFLDDDKDVPYGHGLTGNIKNMPVFEDSVQVGSFDNWSIEDIEIEGRMRKCLCAAGYINEARYPNFVKWIEDKIAEGQTIHGSVEFVGTKENDGEIQYENGWKQYGRVPTVYDYSGYCILSIRPSDSAAVLLELNQALEMNEFDGVFGDGLENRETVASSDDFDVFGNAENKLEINNVESSEFDDVFGEEGE